MKSEFKSFRIVPYGEVAPAGEPLASGRRSFSGRSNRLGPRRRPLDRVQDVWIAYSHEFDDSFSRTFLEEATPDARLLLLNEGHSSDKILSRIVDLQIRTAHRFYVADLGLGAPKSRVARSLLERLTSTLEAGSSPNRIFDATIENGMLRVISPDFRRLEISISKIRSLEKATAEELREFEIDQDGSFICWPKLDVHLGWEQLDQIINPAAALKARQKDREFNIRYGKAVRKLREQAGLGFSDIGGLSEKQIRRIESGTCRLTSNAIGVLAEAHRLTAVAYLDRLAEVLGA